MRALRVVLAEDNTLLHERLSQLIEANGTFELTGAVEMARRSSVRRVMLFHHKPDRSDEALDEMLARLIEAPHLSIASESTVRRP